MIGDAKAGLSEASPDTVSAPTKAHTASKRERGVVTPKRHDAQSRRVEAPPANRREAAKRVRDKQRAVREEERRGMIAGDPRYLMGRDQGPVRALVRDIVDSRRNLGSIFFLAAFAVLFSGFFNPAVVAIANLTWLAVAILVVVDCVLLCVRVRRTVRERFPKSEDRMAGLYFYAIMRALSFRKMRAPKPRVKTGEKV